MSTTPSTAPASSATAAPAAPRSVGRRVARLLGALAILFGGLFAAVGAQAPAQAAVSYNTGITFCAKWTNGVAYANYPVKLQYKYAGHWYNHRNGTTASNGCGTFRNVDSGWEYRVIVNWSTNTGCPSTYVYGTSSSNISFYDQIRSVGTFWVGTSRLC